MASTLTPAAESAFAGGLGATISLDKVALDSDLTGVELPGVEPTRTADYVKLFSESNTRFLAEVPVAKQSAFEAALREASVPFAQIGQVDAEARLTVLGADGEKLIDADVNDLKLRWQKPFDLGGEYAAKSLD